MPCNKGCFLVNENAVKLILFVLGILFSTSVTAFELADDRGALVQFDQTPKRIISLLPSITETICMLGQCDRLVGVDAFSNYPLSVEHLKTLGSGLSPHIEKIIALKPDLVLIGMSPRAAEHLKSFGLKVFSIEASRYQDVQRMLEKLALILSVPKGQAESLWLGMNEELDALAMALPVVHPKLNVYFEVGSAPYAAGPDSFIGETLKRLGVENIIPARLGAFPKINPELVVRSNPDVMMVSDKNTVHLKDRPGWSQLRAIREGRICYFTEQESDVIVRAGPRLAEGAKAIARCLSKYGYSAVIGLTLQ
jgi:iron complex transport system substrate-binding protein